MWLKAPHPSVKEGGKKHISGAGVVVDIVIMLGNITAQHAVLDVQAD